jgi:transglutaminase-like putative cysteine protease
MHALIHRLVRHFRPRLGWPLFLLLLAFALIPALAATNSRLRLTANWLQWAGLLSLLVGLRFPQPTKHAILRWVQRLIWLVSALGLGVWLLFGIWRALPPLGLLFQDAQAYSAWLAQGAERDALPLGRTWVFLSAALPRAWRTLLEAPNSGERGAQLMVNTGGLVLTWLGALLLGCGVAYRGRLLAWGAPLLLAVTWTVVLGGGSLMPLIASLGLLLLLGQLSDFERRTHTWDAENIDFSGELALDLVMWGSGAIALLVLIAALLPAWLDNPIARQIWPEIEAPSGLAAIEQAIRQPPRPLPVTQPGVSRLPALRLGQSLEQAPPEQIALRIRLNEPLAPAPWPRYWRARLFSTYTGSGWTQAAQISPAEPLDVEQALFTGAILQEIEDAQPDRGLAIGLPNVIALDVAAQSERFSDGSQAALTFNRPISHYKALSFPQELSRRPVDAAPPDMSLYTALPSQLPPQIGETARAITQDVVGDYERALAIETFLRELPYSYEVQPLPNNGDAVYQFLFEMRHGYCTYYASAMAVLARTVGIPARLAVGYATGTYDAATDRYEVREADAHAWPELYIDGRWIPFEPTPIRELPPRNSTAPLPEPLPTPPELMPQPSHNLAGPLIWLGVVAAVVGTTLFLGWWARRTPEPLEVRVQRRLERVGKRARVAWPIGATLQEYGALLAARLGGAALLRELVTLLERARYGPNGLDSLEERRLQAADERLRDLFRRKR